MTARAGPPGHVRIIAGEWRRRHLPVPPGDRIRPTADRVRETLFNWLQPRLADARCLDLFAGSGSLGFEAVSRGAARAVLVEHAPASADQLRRNADLLGAGARIEVVCAEALEFLAHGPARPFDIVFLDPPYTSDLLHRALSALIPDWLAPGGCVYIEQPRGAPRIALPEGWRMMREGETRHACYGLIQGPG